MAVYFHGTPEILASLAFFLILLILVLGVPGILLFLFLTKADNRESRVKPIPSNEKNSQDKEV